MELWNYRDYILYSVRAKLLSETIRNHLGILWMVLEPIMRMFVYYFVFVYLIHRRTEDFTSFLLIGIIAFTWFSKTLTQGGNSISGSGRLIKQVYLPKIIFPTITSLVRTIEFIVIFLTLLIYLATQGYLSVSWIALPGVILAQFLFIYGATIVMACIIPFIPDISYIISSLMTALFFLSGILFEVKPSNPKYDLFMLNPLAKLLEQYRLIILQGSFPEWLPLVYIGGSGIVMALVVSQIIKKLEFQLPRIV